MTNTALFIVTLVEVRWTLYKITMKGTFVFKKWVKVCSEKIIPLSSYRILIHRFRLNITVGIQKLDIIGWRFACGPIEARVCLSAGVYIFFEQRVFWREYHCIHMHDICAVA